jgi:hypothetical protein
MFHIELRQSFHNFNQFNANAEELRALVEPWVRDERVEIGERRWDPYETKLIVLEGPHLPVEELSMGRGWRTAERESQDVTERVLAEARQALAAAPAPTGSGTPAPASALADPLALGVALGLLLGDDPGRLLAAWRETTAQSTGLSPSEALAVAERGIRASSDSAGTEHGR